MSVSNSDALYISKFTNLYSLSDSYFYFHLTPFIAEMSVIKTKKGPRK